MKNFLKVAEGCDIMPLRHAIQRQPELWGKYPVRTTHPRSAHYGGTDILLRYQDFVMTEGFNEAEFVDKVCANIQCVNYPPFESLPEARPLVFGLMSRLEGEHLGRVFVSKVPAGGTAPVHNDIIPEVIEAFPDRIHCWIYYERYHLILQSQPGVVFRTGDEQITPKNGEVWWNNTLELHDVINNSSDDFIHLMIDIRSHRSDYVHR